MSGQCKKCGHDGCVCDDTLTPRDKFEDWANREGLSIDKRTEGHYNCGYAVVAWEAWQAASKELTAAREQRDRLAGSLRNISLNRAHRYESTVNVMANIADAALQSLNQNDQNDATRSVEHP